MADRERRAPTCISDSRECAGAVEYRTPLSGSGRAFPRCDKHWQDRIDLEHDVRRRYPATAPADFDPSYAGERWDDN